MTGAGGRARRVDRYLAGALREIRRAALFSGDVDWEAVHRDAEGVLARAGSYADTHPFLAGVLAEAGGRHSRLVPVAERGRDRARAASGGTAEVPYGELRDGIGAVVLPRAAGGRAFRRRYVEAGGQLVGVMARSRPRGWIVDLRRNSGGGMWPMLAAVAGLLEPGDLGYFALPGERSVSAAASASALVSMSLEPWVLGRRWVTAGRRPMTRHGGARLRAEGVPVAVLTSGRTASAGEAVALALRGQSPSRTFGTPTAGLTTANRTHLLRDGTRLWISERYYADRDRRPATGPVLPDEVVPEGVVADGAVADPDPRGAPAAARRWIDGFGGDRRARGPAGG